MNGVNVRSFDTSLCVPRVYGNERPPPIAAPHGPRVPRVYGNEPLYRFHFVILA